MATVIGIDYGLKKIGFSVGQTITKTASPLEIITNNSELWVKIDVLMKDWRPEFLVVGEPKLADGTVHPLENSIENCIKKIKLIYNIDVYREDESFSSVEASRRKNNKRKSKSIDDYAAAVILESWLQG